MPAAERALFLSVLLACTSTFISALEIVRRPEYIHDGHLLSWPASRLRYAFLTVGHFGNFFDTLLRARVFAWLMYVRLSLALVAPFTTGRLRGAVLLLLVMLYVLWSLRSPYGQDGSDQMGFLILLSIALSDIVGTHVANILATRFIAAQLALSYFVAGTAKVASPSWRSGQALQIVSRSSIYGHQKAHRVLMSHPCLALTVCWMVIALEIAFPAGLLTPTSVTLAVIAAMAGFHIGGSYFMGLNNFMVAFLAAYPCWIAIALPAPVGMG
jgi:hypothetical protein